MNRLFPASLAVAASLSVSTTAQTLRPDQQAFRDLYQELVETNTTLSAGSCTVAAEKMAARLKAAGFSADDVKILIPNDYPKQGNLVAILWGTDKSTKPILLLAHIDVVEARAEDWDRDPFKLVEKDGFFYARGVSDDKAMASVFVDSLIRYKQEGFRPKRDIKLALTCGEETPGQFNGVRWLIANHRPLIDAAFALNEGAGGLLDEKGNRVSFGIQAGEKIYQDFRLEITNRGGHSSTPVKDNAITRLSAGLVRLGAYDFPVEFNGVTRSYFLTMSKLTPGTIGNAMARMFADGTPPDMWVQAVDTVAAANPSWNSMMRTTCVATQVEAGHAPNALPQRAWANVNCRILPGKSVESVRQDIIRVIADNGINVSLVDEPDPIPPLPELNPAILQPAETVAAKLWPGVPLVPTMATGGTDGRFLNAAGIPTYGLSGMFIESDGSHAHGLNERLRARSLYEGRDFLYEVVKLYAMGG